MGKNPVVQSYAYLLVHAPEFVRYGSKPRREIGVDPTLAHKIDQHLRSFEDAVRYPPNQVFLGNLHPEDLAARPNPWWQNPVQDANSSGSGAAGSVIAGSFGDIKVGGHWLFPT